MRTKLTTLFVEFLESEQASGVVLIVCTLASILIANSSFAGRYLDFWHAKIGLETDTVALKYSVEHWINDGLMGLFFLLIGLEIERELFVGELADRRNSILPVLAAVGGMSLPALIHFLFNRGTATQAGVAIPMATDIAFALGVLALLGNKVPASLKVFLTALAIIDDLGAIIVIALFYVGDFSPAYFLLALGIFAGLFFLNRLRVHALPIYLISGAFMWYFMLRSGVHATIAGVLLAFVIPFGDGGAKSPSYRLQHFLHKPVAFLILPLFALANTGITVTGQAVGGLVTSNSLGILAGLILGKPLGIVLFCFLAIKAGWSRLPADTTWKHLIGGGFLSGIGFTMSVFITLLAFHDFALVQSTKFSVLLGSLTAGLVGYLLLNSTGVVAAAENARRHGNSMGDARNRVRDNRRS